MSEFIMDVEAIQRNARTSMAQGAVTGTYRADKGQVLKLLQGALATEWICVLRYSQHQVAAEGIEAEHVAKHFGKHAREEHDHAMRLAARIKQLGGEPHMDPQFLSGASHSQYKECNSLYEMIQENLYAERIAVSAYTEMVNYIGERDPTSRRLLEDILGKEEEHADEMASLLRALDPREPTN